MLIFAIDDEHLLLKAAERAIGEAAPSAKILTFIDALDALDAIKTQELFPDIVFSDIEMPGISGLEFAVKLKILVPNARIVFVTGFSKYAVAAFKIRANGYIMKPLTPEAVKDELCAIPVGPAMAPDKLFVRCFGHFEVFWQGKPVLFGRKQTKELFAFLIDREGAACTSEEIMGALWEGETDVKAARQRIRNLVYDMKNTLHSIGIDDVLIRGHKQLAIRRDMVDCDYYRMLSGDMSQLNAFRGKYMVDYSWAELTTGKLYFR